MKRLFIFLILLSFLFLVIGCNKPTDKDIFNEFQKTINNIENYRCISNITIHTNGKQSFYKVEETFIKPDKFKLEIIEPKESKGCTIVYDGKKIYLKHPSIEQSITLKEVKKLDKKFLMGYFFQNLTYQEELLIESDKIKEDEYLVLTIGLPENNHYRKLEKIWFKKEDFTPYKLNILDNSGLVNVEVFYEDFLYDVDIDKDL